MTLASVFGSSCSNVLWVNRVQSCLSMSPRLGFLSLFCSAFLSCWRLFSILVISSSFVLITVISDERPASFSAGLFLRLPPSSPATTCGSVPCPVLCLGRTTLYLFGVPVGPLVCPSGSCGLPDLCSAVICRCVSAQLPGSQRPRYVRM